MNAKQRRTLQRIFAQPTPVDFPWTDIESLFRALGATITQGSGSRVRVELHGVRAVFHEPHPQRHTLRGAVRAVRDFLESAGVQP
jgi:hypothetical protein